MFFDGIFIPENHLPVERLVFPLDNPLTFTIIIVFLYLTTLKKNPDSDRNNDILFYGLCEFQVMFRN